MTTTTVPRRLKYREHTQMPTADPARAMYGVELALSLAYDTEDFEVYALVGLVRPDLNNLQVLIKIDELLDLSAAVDETSALHYSAEAYEAARDEYRDALRSFVGAP